MNKSYKLKTGKGGRKVMAVYNVIEKRVCSVYRKVEAGVVSRYKTIEKKFIEAFLEEVDSD